MPHAQFNSNRPPLAPNLTHLRLTNKSIIMLINLLDSKKMWWPPHNFCSFSIKSEKFLRILTFFSQNLALFLFKVKPKKVRAKCLSMIEHTKTRLF